MSDRREKASVGLQWLIASGVLAVVSIGGWALYGLTIDRPGELPSVRLTQAERGTVETTINVSGVVQLRGQQTLKSPAEGAVDEVLVGPGDRVRSGEVLLTLRNPERETALLNQQLAINQQQARLDREQQRIVESREQLELEQARLQRLSSLTREGAIPRRDVEDQQTEVRQTLANLRTAEADRRNAELELERLQLERRRIQRQLQDTVLTSPIDGVVLGVEVKDGDGVEFRTNLVTVGDPTQELVDVELSTLDASQVRVDQLARVSVIGPNNQVFLGRVASLYPQAIASSAGDSGGEQSNQAVVPTTVLLDRPSRTLIPGSQVNVEIVLQQRQNVLMLGIEAVQRSPSTFVWVLGEENRVQRRPIDIGLEGLTTVEITSGLTSSDRVVLPPTDTTLEPGMQVNTTD